MTIDLNTIPNEENRDALPDVNTLQSISTSTMVIDLNTIPAQENRDPLPDLNENPAYEQVPDAHPLKEVHLQEDLHEGHAQHLHIGVHGIDLNVAASEEELFHEGEFAINCTYTTSNS
jgi:hypothetical protein